MLRSIKDLQGSKVHATDGEIGKVHEFLFDDISWKIRYMVVDTGNWLQSRLVLISPHSLGKPDWDAKLFPVNLTKDKIKNSPTIDTHQPVSRQHEQNLSDYYGWPYYWAGAGAGFPGAVPPVTYDLSETGDSLYAVADKGNENQGDPHLRSTKETIDYKIQAEDDRIGNVEDFIVDDDIWSIRFLVVDTGNWLLPGKKVLIALPWIRDIDWTESSVYVDLTTAEVKQSPEYDPDKIVNRQFETELHNHYKRPIYWKET
ncbi:MAG: PRC-barrel domain-containing protein [Bacillota bacterium]